MCLLHRLRVSAVVLLVFVFVVYVSLVCSSSACSYSSYVSASCVCCLFSMVLGIFRVVLLFRCVCRRVMAVVIILCVHVLVVSCSYVSVCVCCSV